MQCQLCNKHATVHLTEIVNGQKIERHLCDECAQKEGITIKTHIPISTILDNLVSAQKEAQELADYRCPQCGITWADFHKRGLLGCPNDYTFFDKTLSAVIKRAQGGATQHIGRIPRSADVKIHKQIRLLQLRQDLQQALQEEDYERAVNLRDEIHKYEMN